MEAALFLVTGLLMAFVAVDLVSLMRGQLRLDQVSSNMASSATQYQKIYKEDAESLFQTAQQMADAVPVSGGVNGATIITGISNTNGTPTIIWQAKDTPGSMAFTSLLGTVGNNPTTKLPDNYALPTGSSVVVVEVFTVTRPWILSSAFKGSTTSIQTIRSVALFQPRASQLPQLLIAESRP